MGLTPEQRAGVIEEAKTWLRTKYHHHGRIKGAGVDCLTFLQEVYQAAGLIETYDPGNYSTQWHLHHGEELYIAGLLRFCDEVLTPQPADVAMFRFGRCFSHGAIVIEWPRVIHSLNPSGCQYGDATQDPLACRPVRFFTLKNHEPGALPPSSIQDG